MSAPHLELKEVEFLSLGFMTNGAVNALEKILNGEDLSGKEIKSLRKAAAFLGDIASGAQFIASGKVPVGFNASRSLEALNYAMGPKESLKKLLKDDDVAKFFKDLALALENAHRGISKDEDRSHLNEAVSFFRAFYRWVIAELNARQPVLGAPRFKKDMLAFS